LQGLRDAFERAAADRSCQLFTILGSAGVGKSRLVAEFLAAADARVVRGRCLSYGEGITYWPVNEILKQLATLPGGNAARPLRSLLGETEEPASAEEIAWGFRKLLEQEAQAWPLVCVFDDLHWGEETLLDLVEHIADLSRDAPLLLLCMARPELLERRSSWGGGKWNATTVLLEPLDASETEQLLSELGEVPEELHARIVRVAEGNPLFLEETAALVRDSGGEGLEVPPTIQALLAARLDQLEPAERSVLERGSIEGRTFHRGAVAALSDGGGEIDRRLVALVRKELVRPERAQLAGDDAYRFRHLLIRDAAYDALPKAVRADLHRRFAAWLEQNGLDLVELDEILGYHLEQAARYLDELGRGDRGLALAAGERLAVGGRRAMHRGDFRAGAALLERSLELTRSHRLDVHLEVELAQSLIFTNTARGLEIAEAATRRAEAAGDEAGAAHARAVLGVLRMNAVPGSTDQLERAAHAALPLLEAAGDNEGLRDAWLALSWVANMRCSFEECASATEQAIKHARAAGPDRRMLGYGNALAWDRGRPARR
jgi:predicted ATPase